MSGRGKVDAKIVMLGSVGVGKTSLLNRHVHGKFQKTESTIGASFALRNYEGYKMGIWDTAGEEKYDSLSSFYCRGARAAVICYDICDRYSFEAVPRFLKKLEQDSTAPDVIKVIVGTKLDLVQEGEKERCVSRKDGQTFARNENARFFETSAKDNLHVDEVFDSIYAQIVAMQPQNKISQRPDSIRLEENESPSANERNGRGGGCC